MCISIVRLNRYVIIQIILLHGFDICISIVRLNRYVIILTILLHGFDVCISTVRLNRYIIKSNSNSVRLGVLLNPALHYQA